MTQANPASSKEATASPLKVVSAMPNNARPENDAVDDLYALIMSQLDDDQAQEIVSIPLEGKSSVADHMIVASGRSTRQVAAMAQKLAEKIKQGGFGPARIEGLPQADWVLIDAGDVVVHLFRPEVRSFYNLERMWSFDGGEVREGRA
jgi:ribosome-associated protein